MVDLAPRLFAPKLAEDLATLGRFPDVCPAHAFKGVAQALGWLYVVERGRLMNSMLHRHLVRRLPFESSIARQLPRRLGLARAALAAARRRARPAGRNPTMCTQIINGALEAFRMMRHPHQPQNPAQKAA